MPTEIRPSLSQMLQPTQTATARPATQAPQQAAQAPGGFASAMAAQRAFFQQVTAPKVTPATYTAADIARAAPAQAPSANTAVAANAAADPNQPPKRPGSFLNIVV